MSPTRRAIELLKGCRRERGAAGSAVAAGPWPGRGRAGGAATAAVVPPAARGRRLRAAPDARRSGRRRGPRGLGAGAGAAAPRPHPKLQRRRRRRQRRVRNHEFGDELVDDAQRAAPAPGPGPHRAQRAAPRQGRAYGPDARVRGDVEVLGRDLAYTPEVVAGLLQRQRRQFENDRLTAAGRVRRVDRGLSQTARLVISRRRRGRRVL